ncbi:MARVEL domain-containing protein 2-like [Gouania willdenowi]|uniref:MARVEL domain-containing protein 2-like n=1 Tax=Gouania willdenowi TaxID=441366 RepID=A0A8C5EX51_GOUWI|nr:MARVEL domain-containing protein 2-like [Gouania willdenowi]
MHTLTKAKQRLVWDTLGERSRLSSALESSSVNCSSSSMMSKPESGTPKPVWVTHTPIPTSDTVSDGGCDSVSSPPSTMKDTKGSLKDRLKALLPPSWTTDTRTHTTGNTTNNGEPHGVQILPNGTRVSPPVTPILERRNWEGSEGSSSHNSHKPLLSDAYHQEDSVLSSIHAAELYTEKMALYQLKYSYLKSWPGLLRLLAGLQLLFGGMVFACVIAYLQKDSEWSNTYGLYNGAYNNGQGPSGYSYGGPMTPFILAVAGISWILTLCLLVVGMTMYYRTILLESSWWPLTEALINVALFLLYMAAGIVYLNDLNRGGLCYMTIGVNPILSNLCRVDGGQMAGTAFIFINMSMYLGSFLVCLKMWRHEAARREMHNFENMPLESSRQSRQSIPPTPEKQKHISFRKESDDLVHQRVLRPDVTGSTSSTDVKIIADYIIKYPQISCVEEREKYKAVFNDQYQEYRDLHRDLGHALSRFSELDVMMKQLPTRGKSPEEQQRIQNIWKKFNQKKNDPSFLEKKQRCDYLKNKLSHIKRQIRTFDQQRQM